MAEKQKPAVVQILALPWVRHTVQTVVSAGIAAFSAWVAWRFSSQPIPSAALPLAPVPGPAVVEVVETPSGGADHEGDMPPDEVPEVR